MNAATGGCGCEPNRGLPENVGVRVPYAACGHRVSLRANLPWSLLAHGVSRVRPASLLEGAAGVASDWVLATPSARGMV